MAHGQAGIILRHICTILDTQAAKSLTDGQLLERFVARRDESAFSVLMQRHGRLVWSVCRNILHPEQDAEDAFQATFLVLARRAESIRKGESVGSWLYGVAHRVAMKAKKTAAKRWRYERGGGMLSPAATAGKHSARAGESMAPGGGELALKELQAILHKELERLPNKYRAPFVLCCLEGRSRKEVAGELGWKEGTVSSRVAEARRQLQRRLTRRGVALSAVLCATAVVPNGASAALAAKTLREAMLDAAGQGKIVSAQVAALADGVMKAMALGKAKVGMALVLAASLVGAGVGLSANQVFRAKSQAAEPVSPEKLLADGGDIGPRGDKKHSRTDIYGDPLPPGARVRMGSVRLRPAEGGKSSGYFMTFLPSGKVLATEGYKGIRFWDVSTGKEVRRIEAPGGGTWSFALSSDGKILAASCFDDTIRLWDAATGKELHKIKSSPGAILAFSHDGRKLVSASDSDFRFRLWNVATGKEELKIDAQRHRSMRVSFTAADQALVSWDYNQGVFYWEVASGKRLRQFAPSDEQLRRFFSPAGGMTSVAFSPDGKLLAAGSLDHTIRIADQATGKEIRKIESREGQAIAFSPDAKTLFASQEGGSILWDVASGQPVRKIPATGRATFSPDGKTLAVGGSDNSAISLWDVATGKEFLHPPGHENSVSNLAFSPDGKVLATRSFSDQTIRLWEADTGRELHLLRLPDQGSPMAFTPDGKSLVAGSWDGTVRFWDPSRGKEIRKIVIDPGKPGRQKWDTIVDSIQLLPDGKSLATCSTKSGGMGPGKEERTGLIQLWEVATGKQLLKHETSVPAYHPGTYFSPDGTMLVYEKSKQIVVWDVARNKKRLALSLSEDNNTGRLASSPDGKYLAAVTYGNTTRGDPQSWENRSTLRLWEVATAQQVLAIPTKDSLVDAVAFSPDGKVVAWGCDEAVRLWDVATGKELLRRAGHRVRVHCLAFAPDGRTLACGLADTTALIWDLAPDTWRAGMPPRELTPEDLDRRWADLAGSDAAKAHQAIWILVAVPGHAVAILKERLQPAREQEQQRIQQWIAELDHPQFAVRERASKQLEQRGAEAEPALLHALRQNPSAEGRRRIEALLELPQIIRPGECLRGLRAIQVLEHIRTPETEKVLKALAKGAPEARLTQEAKAALVRLARQSGE